MFSSACILHATHVPLLVASVGVEQLEYDQKWLLATFCVYPAFSFCPNSFAFAVVGKYQQDDLVDTGAGQTSNTATMFGLLNLSIVLPQLIVTFAVGSMRTNITDGLSWVLVMAGVSMGIAGICALFVHEVVPKKGSLSSDSYA